MQISTSPIPEGGRRSIQLDFLRGIAIMLVIGRHLRFEAPDGFVSAVSGIWHQYGTFGVPLFFTLSGYLVGGLLLVELQRHGTISFSRFLIRRGLKIYPAYIVFLVYLIVMPTAKAIVAGLGGSEILRARILDYLPNILFLNNYLGLNPAGHTWSLAVEEHFYVTLPLMMIALAWLRRAHLIMPICLLAPIFFTFVRLAGACFGDPCMHVRLDGPIAATHLCIDGLFVGVGIRAAMDSPQRISFLRPWRYAMIAFGMIVLILPDFLQLPVIAGIPMSRIFPFNTIAASAILMGTLLVRSSDFGIMASTIGVPAFFTSWIGRYSYGIYLWHITILGFTERMLLVHLPDSSQGALPWIADVFIATMLIIFFGAFMSRIVEWPILKLRDRYFPSRNSRALSPPPFHCAANKGLDPRPFSISPHVD